MGHVHPKFLEPPSSETTGWIRKWHGHALSTCKVWWQSAAARRRETEKFDVFLYFFSVCHGHVTRRLMCEGVRILINILSPFIVRF